MMSKKRLTHQEFVHNLRQVQPDYEIVDVFVTTRTKATFLHKTCGYQFVARPSNVTSGKGCPFCARNQRMDVTSVNDRLIESGSEYELIGEYKNARTPSLFRHKRCGYEWLAQPDSILRGSGCPECASAGFKSSRSGFMYLIRMNLPDGTKCIKYGIANDVARRLREHRRYGEVIVIECRRFDTGSSAKTLENKIKSRFEGNFVSRDQLPNGYTETLSVDHMNEVLKIIHNHQ